MPRKIISQDPIVVAAEPKKTFDEMQLASFKVIATDSGLRLRANLQKVDSNGTVLPGDDYPIAVNDLEAQMAVTPRFEAAWDTIVDVMGLAYDFFRLRDKVDEAMSRGEDVTELIAARNSALAALRAPV